MALQDIDPTTPTPLDASAVAAEFEAELVEHMPLLRVYALSLSGRRDFAEDLAQEALAKAWSARGSFTPGSNLKAWLYVILRNEYYTRQRRSWRQAPWEPALGEMIAAPHGQQQWAVELSDLACAIRGLSESQREALILVGVGGFSHDDAAALSKTPVGTVKSRVGRARKALKRMLDGDTSLPIKSRPATGDAMNEILAQLSHLCVGRRQDTCSPA
jgi:RNA polymerase sigma-70 factor (ECF subfamily)